MKVDLSYLARVEGEGAVSFEIRNGRLEDLRVRIWEPPRFFEGFMVGRRFDEIPDIVARICGICPISHMTTAIRAIEKALGLEVPPATAALQRIMALSQMVASHLVHLYMLALPDYHRLTSMAEMLPDFTPQLQRLLRMKEAVNGLGDALGGRALHPVGMTVNGFTRQPDRQVLGELMARLEEIKPDALETVKMIADLPVPELANTAEYVALSGISRYGINRGTLISSEGLRVQEEEYLDHFLEEQVPYAHAKRTVVKGRGAIMVGALARLNLKFDLLHPDARAAAAEAGFRPPSHNPFHNNLAQAIEVVHGISECFELLDSLPPEKPWVEVEPREGRGEALTEAPRGLLFHAYTLNSKGIVEQADLVTPTAHNFLSLEENLRRLIESRLDLEQEELSRQCAMLVRAYDPCFSCSVH
ncbi:MAG: Ni/Fe hydrogenase subunit alpha [Deltaproteobacteria bacterium]